MEMLKELKGSKPDEKSVMGQVRPDNQNDGMGTGSTTVPPVDFKNDESEKKSVFSFIKRIFTKESSEPTSATKPIRPKVMAGAKSTLEEDVIDETLAIEETSVLDSENGVKNYPYLIRLKNNEQVPINKPVFNIGRESSKVDYWVNDSKFVGRKHACIISKNNAFYIVDENTTNHTYINGNRIPGGVEIKIEHGERITMANEEFEFNVY
jgi:hypothetical protein